LRRAARHANTIIIKCAAEPERANDASAGRFLSWPKPIGLQPIARGTAAKAYEKGVAQRVVIVEFDSVDKAVAAHDGAGYQAALKVLGNAVERDLRIVEGLA
jgi:uncharacterized protein (DUF1330 family)